MRSMENLSVEVLVIRDDPVAQEKRPSCEKWVRSRFYPQGLEESVFTKQENFDKHAILTRSTNILALQNKKAIFIVFHQSSRTFQLRMSEIL